MKSVHFFQHLCLVTVVATDTATAGGAVDIVIIACRFGDNAVVIVVIDSVFKFVMCRMVWKVCHKCELREKREVTSTF